MEELERSERQAMEKYNEMKVKLPEPAAHAGAGSKTSVI